MGCPKCGYSGHNKVFHFGTGEIECESCGHDYVRNRSDSKKNKESFAFPLFDLGKDIRFSNDVWVAPNGKTSMFRTLGGTKVGLRSPLPGDDSVLDHNFRPIGRIVGDGYFRPNLKLVGKF